MVNTKKFETATFANGCFWCTEAVFKRVKGVESVVSGYAGGTLENPTYYDVAVKQRVMPNRCNCNLIRQLFLMRDFLIYFGQRMIRHHEISKDGTVDLNTGQSFFTILMNRKELLKNQKKN